MSLDKSAKICMVLKNDSEVDLFKSIMVQNKIKNISAFTSANLAYETATRSQFELFITNVKLNDQPGIVLLQRLRNCGNYGMEPYLFVGESVDSATMNLFAEHDIEYVITKPYSPEKIINKLFYVFKQESNLSPQESAYRNAKAAFQSKMEDMAWEMASDSLKQFGTSEKLEVLMGDILLAKGEIMKAREFYQKALDNNPKSLAAQHKIAATMVANKEYDQAKSILNKLAEENPDHIDVLENAGLSNYETGDVKKAKKYLSRVQDYVPESKVAATVMTKVKIDEGQVSGLAEDLKKSLSEKELVSLLNSAGIKLSKENKVDEAIKIYLDCLAHIENKEFAGKVHYNLALAYQKLENKEETKKHLQKTLEYIPTFSKASAMLNKLSKSAA
ncbi:tetratricopeptide repeat protein [Pseudobacteriovorax antillogorgiicola]|uniref:Tetratricopeptide repeat-containing protein n=1 Tax=Pseudobacteriovorax antillogorgiicola TaxID=1513793 RepID=A0A1Y6CM42_9BACT|nr:tetratricopeptide repeat protein [Pseudobacteriovorax antillogorgiicola]TCS45409.1 tetratricopeptide repeat protein [Pseudobacteriovorax antillogorgiicola]SMF73985.1 Tetratricopeptide repeat-containing protein [Pseudobacteriovorax antillogorgiicola]